MRRLLSIPIVHEPADMGSVGNALLTESVRLAGERRWSAHLRTLARFWERVGDRLDGLDPTRLRIYQDGLAAGGELGRRVVEQAADRGSRNHQLVLRLLERGAELRPAEDLGLLLLEQRRARAGAGRAAAEAPAPERLLEERDRVIARNIGSTLREGEIGVLFIGAEHRVCLHLAPDIAVEPVKDRRSVLAYARALFVPGEDAAFAELARYLEVPAGG